jgi:uncharacterized protein YaaN involved in tellurite resistance
LKSGSGSSRPDVWSAVNRNKEPAKGGFTMSTDNIFDGAVPSPAPIRLTFGEEGSPEIAVDDVIAQAEKAAAQAQEAAAQAQAEADAKAAADAVAQAAAQVQAAPAAAQVQAAPAPTAEAIMAAQAARPAETVQEVRLTAEEQKMVDDFAKKINLHDSNAIMTYGAGTQKKMSDFSDQALANVRNKDLGEVGSMISGLVTELKDFDVKEDDGGFLKFFKKQSNKLVALQARYDKTEQSVDTIVNALEKHQVQLLKDVATLDQMYALNLSYFKELSMYIAAGKKRLAEVRAGELKELQDRAAASGDAQDAQEAKDFGAMCDRFEKKLHDLELTRMIALQTGPQIRLVQDADTLMAEKIQSTIVNTIPLWKNQMVIAMGVEHSNQAAKAQHEVSELTNQLLKKNAQQLHSASVETAKESERGIVDIETLKQTNAELISTLDDVLRIQEEGRAKRSEAEAEMARMEAELKSKLLELSKTSR